MKPSRLKWILTASIASFGCGATPTTNTAVNTTNSATPAPTANVAATPADELAGGMNLYQQNCAACHKEDGKGGRVTIEGKSLDVEDLTAEKIKKFTDEKIIGYVTNGVEDEGMPAFKDDLTAAEIREVVAYVRRDIQKVSAQPAR